MRSFLDVWGLAVMHRDGDKLEFIHAWFVIQHTPAGAWKKFGLVFHRNVVSFLAFDKVQLDVRFVRCLERREYFARPSRLVDLLKRASGKCNEVDVYLVSGRAFDFLPFQAFEADATVTSTVQWDKSVVAWSWISAKLRCFPVLDLVLAYYLRWFPGGINGYECRCELNVLSPELLASFLCHSIAETDPRAAIWCIVVCNFNVFCPRLFLGVGTRWSRFSSGRGRGNALSRHARVIYIARLRITYNWQCWLNNTN